MDRMPDRMDRLYTLYRYYHGRLCDRIVEANRLLGSSHPAAKLAPLSQSEFTATIDDNRDPEAIRLWLCRIVRGHEDEFPELVRTSDSRSRTNRKRYGT